DDGDVNCLKQQPALWKAWMPADVAVKVQQAVKWRRRHRSTVRRDDGDVNCLKQQPALWKAWMPADVAVKVQQAVK
ncbi:hypothetical protein, partial [Aquitalea magnusonii]|uniref:hypothetical protein n=1 Tax=Aquitalea magnusonii TaxID=332411 RepID=UPI00195CDC35